MNEEHLTKVVLMCQTSMTCCYVKGTSGLNYFKRMYVDTKHCHWTMIIVHGTNNYWYCIGSILLCRVTFLASSFDSVFNEVSTFHV